MIAVAGNHDSPSRLHFASSIMKSRGFHVTGEFTEDFEPIKLNDEYGEVHFHTIPYTDPSIIRIVTGDEEIRTHNDAARKIVDLIKEQMDAKARHVFVGHLFVTPYGEEQENTSDSERPLSIGGAEYVSSEIFNVFHYTALGHLHQAHYTGESTIRYSGSPLKYSSSEAKHQKGFYVVDLDEQGNATIDKQLFNPKRDMRVIKGKMEELLSETPSEDYVFVHLEDETPILSPMEKIRAVFPNTLHIHREISVSTAGHSFASPAKRDEMDRVSLFKSFYYEVKGTELKKEEEIIFKEILEEFEREERNQ